MADGTGPVFDLRAIEMHGDRMWSWRWVKRAIDTAAAQRMNALVLHRNDIIDMLVFPRRYFDVGEIWARWPVRYHNIDNNRQYLRMIMRYAADVGVRVLLEVKEISFHDSLLRQRPALVKDGAVCASDPFWWEFLEAKLDELFDALPDLAGIIASPATRETRVTISANECRCPRCQATDPQDWYRDLIRAMFAPVDRRGKTLAIRDFTYTRGAQSQLLRAVAEVSERIVISLKNTPHDFYPTFPDNARIGDVGRHPQWVEFDTWGQFFGLGVFPSIVVEDLSTRFRHAAAHGATGVIARTDWEVISDGSVFDTLNLANLTGFGALCWNPETTPAQAIAAALHGPVATAFGAGLDERRFDLAGHDRARRALQHALERSWEVMSKSVFVLRHVFHEDAMFPDSQRKAWMMLTDIHGIADWDAALEGALELNEARIAAIFAEKDEALALVEALAVEMHAATPGLPQDARSQLDDSFSLWVLYVRGFRHCARACFATRHWQERPEPALQVAARREIADLAAFQAELVRLLAGTRHPYLLYWMLDTERLAALSEDLHRITALVPA
jgi:hypothetical protein